MTSSFLAAVLTWGPWGAAQEAQKDLAKKSVVRFDFEQPGLSKSWSAQGKIRIVRGELPAEAPDEEEAGPTGHGVEIQASPKSGFGTRSG